MSRAPIPTWYFALVVVRRGQRFLLTQEQKYGSTWSIPGGRVEPGESMVDAAVREVVEETGIPVRIDGILRIEHAPNDSTARVRVLFDELRYDNAAFKAALSAFRLISVHEQPIAAALQDAKTDAT